MCTKFLTTKENIFYRLETFDGNPDTRDNGLYREKETKVPLLDDADSKESPQQNTDTLNCMTSQPSNFCESNADGDSNIADRHDDNFSGGSDSDGPKSEENVKMIEKRSG